MISLAAVSSAGGAAGYYARDNYYTADQGTEASAWAGQGAALLGLQGSVNATAFEAVLGGELPDGSILGAKRGEHRPGLDLTFSVSKSVSLVAMLGGDQRIVTAIQASVAATLGWVERNLAEARVWNGNEQIIERTGNLVAATFLHDVNRNGEPQLHVHAVLANATRASDGAWHAFRNDELYRRQHVIGAVHNADLRARIEALGYATVPARNAVDGSFEIAGVSREAIDAFSTRSAEIRAALEAGGRGSAREREIAALATRSAKSPALKGQEREGKWAELECAIGFDAARVVSAALERHGRGETMWGQVVDGVRGIGARGLAIAGAMGLTPRDGDPLVPERLGRLNPSDYATAQAVASASRGLSEREAAFDRLDLVCASLERGGPVTVAEVEARIALLEDKRLLRGDGDRLVTTQSAITLEQRMLDVARTGVERSASIVDPLEAGPRAQAAARALGLRRLNPEQEAAAALVLGAKDRTIVVQGVAGAGKSKVLAPVAAIAKENGHAVLGLALANKVVKALQADTRVPATTIASFLLRHDRLLDGTASREQLAMARATLGGAVIMVDEASIAGTHQLARIIEIANLTGVARLALVGDSRQLAAIEAGKPFALLQKEGTSTAELSENLRAKSPMMKAVAKALNANELARAFELLKPATIEVPRDEGARAASAMWAALPAQEREATLLLASGRATRTAANAAVQALLRQAGEIGNQGVRIEVLDRVNIGREGARQMRGYRDGHVVEFRTDLPSQGFSRGDRGTVVGADGDRVELRITSGETKVLRPGKLAANMKQDAVSITRSRRSNCTRATGSGGPITIASVTCSMPGSRGWRRSGTGLSRSRPVMAWCMT